MITKNMNK